MGHPSGLGGALVVQGEQASEDFVFGQRPGPAVGGEDRLVERAMGVFEPGAFAGGAQVVKLGEGTVFQVFGGGSGRIEPGVAQTNELAGGLGDGADDGGVGFGRFGAGGVGEGASRFRRMRLT